MSEPGPVLTIEALLEHSSWVRDLARRLASGADAEDLEQRTWLAALASRPRSGVPAREWLAKILRNFAREQRRSDRRRKEREERAARAEASASASEVVEKVELQRRLVEAVMQLDEPYRTTLLLRYSEGLPPREVARRLGVPVATVRTRIARAIERLRGRLDDAHGGNRGAWIAAFAPLFRPPIELAPPATLALFAMTTKSLLCAAAALLLAAAGWWFVRDDGSPSAAEVAPETVATVRSPESAGSSGALEVAPSSLREAVDEPSPVEEKVEPAAAAPEPANSPSTVRGRVLDPSGAAVANVALVALSTRTERIEQRFLTSDGSGRFAIEDAPASGTVSDGDPGLSTVLRATFRAGETREPIVVVAPRIDLAGVVVDENGAPLEGVDLGVELPEDFRSRFREVLDSSIGARWAFATEADGRFELDDLPSIEGARLAARATGFESRVEPLPGVSDPALRIVLTRPQALDGVVRGRVVDARGAPIRGARVALGIDTVLTPDDGTFAFEIDDPKSFSARVGIPREELVAAKAGLLPARYEPPVSGGKPQWPAFVTLRLDGVPLAISGVVVGADREPRSAVRVFLIDATVLGAVDDRPAMLENLLAGSDQLWTWVETDALGRFELQGLLDRDYALRAHDPATLLRVDSGPVRAGSTGVRLELPTDELFLRVAGRITSSAGRPIANATVFPMCDAFQARVQRQIVSTSHDAVDGTRTDADGRFELANVPKSLVYLRIEGERILPLEYGRYVEGDPRFEHSEVRELPRDSIESLEIQVELRCHFQVELADPGLADEVGFLDASGRELVVNLFTGEGRRDTPRHPLLEGRSAVLGVPDSATTVVLFREGREVARKPVEPDPEKVTTVRL